MATPPSQLQSLEQEKGRWRVEKAQLEQSVEENKERMEKLEGYWGEAQSLCQAVDEHLRETQAQYQALERKYSKAKRLIKDYQQKYVVGGCGSWAQDVDMPSVQSLSPPLSRETRSAEVEDSKVGYLGLEWLGPRGTQGQAMETLGNLGPPDLRSSAAELAGGAEDRAEDPDSSLDRSQTTHPYPPSVHYLSPGRSSS